jgi:hypothetical protein
MQMMQVVEVIAMARGARIHAETTEFPLTAALTSMEAQAGQITGRAVLVPA